MLPMGLYIQGMLVMAYIHGMPATGLYIQGMLVMAYIQGMLAVGAYIQGMLSMAYNQILQDPIESVFARWARLCAG